ncbi:MAG: preprotein translocase subunit SecE [Pirellulales bacterium]
MTTKEGVIAERPMLKELFASTIYKRNQGRMVRQITCLAIWAAVLVGAWRFHATVLEPNVSSPAAGYLIAVAVAAIGMWCAYRLVNWPKFADFLIAVEAELNKVSWPGWRELNRASMVVIFTIFFMAFLLFGYDFVWGLIFTWLGIV